MAADIPNTWRLLLAHESIMAADWEFVPDPPKPKPVTREEAESLSVVHEGSSLSAAMACVVRDLAKSCLLLLDVADAAKRRHRNNLCYCASNYADPVCEALRAAGMLDGGMIVCLLLDVAEAARDEHTPGCRHEFSHDTWECAAEKGEATRKALRAAGMLDEEE